MQRANGFYHDMVTSRMYVLQGLLTLSYVKFSNRFSIKPLLSWLFVIIFLVSSFTLFSKALIGIVLLGGVLLVLLTKQKLSHYLIGSILFLILIINNIETLVETTTTLFSAEIEYNTGELNDSERLFSGRGGIWQGYLNSFENALIIEKAIGFGINSGRTHNEFLRILIFSGVIGLIAYIVFLLNLIFKLCLSSLFSSQLSFVSVFSLIILLIDSISVVWGLYPFYLIVVIGFYLAAIEEIKIKNMIIAKSNAKL